MSDVDPMLDGITRYVVPAMHMTNAEDTQPERPYQHERLAVLFSDLPALLATVREDAVRDWADRYNAAYERGQRDERERIRAFVNVLPVTLVDVRFNPADAARYVQAAPISEILAVIDATPCPTCNGNGATGPADDPDTCQACRGRGEL